MKYKFNLLMVIAAFSALPFLLYAQEQKMTAYEMAAFKKSVAAVAQTMHTMSTDFVQYKHLDFLSKDIETTGTMGFKSPAQLQWAYKKPYHYGIVFKNNKILIDDEGKKSKIDIGNSDVFSKINKLIVGSVSGALFDDQEFTVTYTKTPHQNIAVLSPKDAALKKYIRQIELTFDPQDATVVQVKLIESSADYTRIVFKNKVLNAKIDESVFSN